MFRTTFLLATFLVATSLADEGRAWNFQKFDFFGKDRKVPDSHAIASERKDSVEQPAKAMSLRMPSGYNSYGDEYDRDSGYGPSEKEEPSYGSSHKEPSYGASPSYEEPAPSYGAPPHQSYGAPDSSYKAPSYEPAPYGHYEEPAYYGDDDGGDSALQNFLNALIAFMPIGLFLAAIPPNLITITVTTGRKRSIHDDPSLDPDQSYEYTYPILDMIHYYGVDSLDKPSCQKRIFCEMARLGGMPEGNSIQRFLYTVAQMSPDFVAHYVGAEGVFKAVRSGACEVYPCNKGNL